MGLMLPYKFYYIIIFGNQKEIICIIFIIGTAP